MEGKEGRESRAWLAGVLDLIMKVCRTSTVSRVPGLEIWEGNESSARMALKHDAGILVPSCISHTVIKGKEAPQASILPGRMAAAVVQS